MSDFSADWLALREPYDHRARNEVVLAAVAAHFAGRDAVSAVDLATGTGSTLRAVAERLPQRQDWRLVDNNLSLLARAEASLGPKRNVRAMPLDLARDLEAALDGPVDLITTSALLDLVSPDWLERLVVEVATRNLPLYAALSFDGRIEFDSSDPLDREIIAAVNAHQRTDKGFGAALGPDAAADAIARFKALGWTVTQGQIRLGIRGVGRARATRNAGGVGAGCAGVRSDKSGCRGRLAVSAWSPRGGTSLRDPRRSR